MLVKRRSLIRFLFGASAAAVLAGCEIAGDWRTDYRDLIAPEEARKWHVRKVDVIVPRSLTVSEANTFAPDADIVWRGDPPGDRYEQVDAIITEAARRGVHTLHGPKPVALRIWVKQFHALTERTRYNLENAGVHNITFIAQIFDARSGKPLTEPDLIRADLIAYTGTQAIAAEARGETQKKRITDHVAKVIAGWIGAGPDDVRGSFTRAGR